MQRDLVERARRGDHDAFAELAGAAISRLEAAGGVERWTAAVADDSELASSLEQATEEQRRVRRELSRL